MHQLGCCIQILLGQITGILGCILMYPQDVPRIFGTSQDPSRSYSQAVLWLTKSLPSPMAPREDVELSRARLGLDAAGVHPSRIVVFHNLISQKVQKFSEFNHQTIINDVNLP